MLELQQQKKELHHSIFILILILIVLLIFILILSLNLILIFIVFRDQGFWSPPSIASQWFPPQVPTIAALNSLTVSASWRTWIK